jgi:uncharacterized protein (TIGR03437 family)
MLLSGALAAAQAPAVPSGGLVNAASFRSSTLSSTARGAIVSVFGTNLAGGVAAADRLPLATQLLDTQVMFDSTPARLFYVSPGQVNLQVPVEFPSSSFSSQLTVRRGGVSSAPITVFLNAQDPGIFTLLQTGSGPGAILHQDGSVVSLANPVRPGEFLTIYATGLGAVTPPVASGQAAPSAPLSTVVNLPTVRIASQVAQISFAGLAPGFVGLYQINVQVPANVTAPTPSVQITQGSGFHTVTAGGPGLQTANFLTAAAGSGDLAVTATGLNLASSASLNFGGRRLASTVQDGTPQTISATIPAAALRVTGTIPLYVTSAESGTGQSNSLNFVITGTTIPGSPPVLSNLTMSDPPATGTLVSNIAFDFQDPDGDIVSNGTSQNSARIEFRHTACGGSTTSTQSGTFLSRPDTTSGRISFQLQFIGSPRRVTGPFNMDVTLIDQAGNRSNTIRVVVGAWVC